jgi:hypothetical protein
MVKTSSLAAALAGILAAAAPAYADISGGGPSGGADCFDARWMLQSMGWRNVVARDCRGAIFVFYATQRDKAYRIRIDSRRNNVISVQRR